MTTVTWKDLFGFDYGPGMPQPVNLRSKRQPSQAQVIPAMLGLLQKAEGWGAPAPTGPAEAWGKGAVTPHNVGAAVEIRSHTGADKTRAFANGLLDLFIRHPQISFARTNMRIAIILLLLIFPVAEALAQQAAPPEIPLWQEGAPGFETRRNETMIAKDYWIRNIHNPSITAYLPPKEKATGAAVVICPGGGHRLLVFKAEGEEPARYLNSIGVAAFVLKYRLGREENSPYSIDVHARQDGQRAMRLVRSRASEWGIDPNRLGMMGFSAGGEVVSMVAFGPAAVGDAKVSDPVDRLSYRPSFVIMIYPGPLGVPEKIPPDAPPAFLLVANDDQCCSPPTMKLLEKYREAKASVEAHLYTQGSHGFNMGNRSKLVSIKNWPQRMTEWMEDSGLLRHQEKIQESKHE